MYVMHIITVAHKISKNESNVSLGLCSQKRGASEKIRQRSYVVILRCCYYVPSSVAFLCNIIFRISPS